MADFVPPYYIRMYILFLHLYTLYSYVYPLYSYVYLIPGTLLCKPHTSGVPQLSDFVPLKHVIRATEVSHAACKDENRTNPDLTADVFTFIKIYIFFYSNRAEVASTEWFRRHHKDIGGMVRVYSSYMFCACRPQNRSTRDRSIPRSLKLEIYRVLVFQFPSQGFDHTSGF